MTRTTSKLRYSLCLVALLGLVAAVGCSTAQPEEDEEIVEQPEPTEIELAHEETGLSIEALEAYQEGVELMDDDFSAAVELFRFAVEDEPTFAEAHYNLGMLLGDMDRPDEAVVHIEKARDLEPDVFDYTVAMAKAYAEAGEYEDARRLFDEVVNRQPDNLTAINNLAVISLREGNEEEALEHVETILREDNQNVGALNTLGLIYMERENISLAEFVLNRALEQEEENPDVHNNLGLVYMQDENLPAAVHHFQRAVEYDQNYLESRLNLGSILIEYLDYDRAYAHFNHAVEMAPEHCVANLGFGAAQFATGEYEGAHDSYEFYVQQCDRDHISSYERLAELNEGQLQRPEKAIEYYGELIEREEDEDTIIQYEAEINFLQGQIDRAQEQQQQAEPEPEEDEEPEVQEEEATEDEAAQDDAAENPDEEDE